MTAQEQDVKELEKIIGRMRARAARNGASPDDLASLKAEIAEMVVVGLTRTPESDLQDMIGQFNAERSQRSNPLAR